MIVVLLALSGAATAADLQGMLDDYTRDQRIPGVSAVVTVRDRQLFSGGSGFADLETGRPMTGHTVMYAGSLTKIMTAIVALQLVDEGRLALDDTVDRIGDPAVNITIAELMNHSSGLSREGDFDYWFTGEFPDRRALERHLSTATLRSPPGRSVHYSNVGYAALGAVIEDADGRSFAEALRVRLVEPLGLEATGAPGPAPGVARGYTPPGRIIPNPNRPFAGVGDAVGDRHLREYHDAAAMTPAFGAWTTAEDLGRLARFLQGFGSKDLLPDVLRLRLLVPDQAGRTLGLGTGTLFGHTVVSHGGWFAAHRSYLLIDLDSSIGIAVLANADNAAPDEIAKALLADVLQPAAGVVGRDRYQILTRSSGGR